MLTCKKIEENLTSLQKLCLPIIWFFLSLNIIVNNSSRSLGLNFFGLVFYKARSIQTKMTSQFSVSCLIWSQSSMSVNRQFNGML